jgi:pilus assembly protein Flp/PilA
MKNLLKKFWQEESGATLVEYAIIVALISVAAIGIIATLGNTISNVFTDIQQRLDAELND